MTDDLVTRLRAGDPETGLRWSIASEAADRIEELEKALIHIWSWYPTNVFNPHQQINEMKDFAFKVIKEGKDE